MERNELLDRFLELKCKQVLLRLWLAAFAKPGYTESEVGLCMSHMEAQAKLEGVEEEMFKLIKENEAFFMGADINGYCMEHKVSMGRQRELSKEVLGKEYTVEDLADKVGRR